jgi:hypothetical protein
MELRLLITERERRIFARRVAQVRAKRDVGFAETPKSRVGTVHIAFGSLYGLFEHDDDPPERIIAGMAMHDLETLPQSYPRPDLTHLPPRSVVEMSEFWSASRGGGLLARRGLTILLKMGGIQAGLIYAVLMPCDRAKSFAENHFERIGEPINYPYARGLDGSSVWVQAMVLWEEGIRKLFDERIGSTRFEVSDDLTRVRFENPLPFQPSLDRPSFPLDEAASEPQIAVSNGHDLEAMESAQR